MRLAPLCILVVLHVSTSVMAQQPAPNQPIELPEIIVQGKSRVDIPGGAKLSPVRPPLLTAALLDSLNPLEKIPPPTLPEAPWPQYSQPLRIWPGWVSARLGNYLTPMIDAGYSFSNSGYLVDLMASAETSTGWVPNSEYTMINIGAMSTYVAPEKFLLFGGSTTIVDAGFSHRSYQLYADTAAPERSTTGLHAAVQTDGASNGITYRGSIAWATTSLTSAANPSTSVSDNHLDGAVEVMKQWQTFDLGAALDVRLRGFADRSYPYTALMGRGAYQDENVMLSASAGPQWATATDATGRFGFRLRGDLDYFVSHDFTVEAHAGTGLRPLDLRDLLQANPYLSDTLGIDVPYDVLTVGGSIFWHPTVRMSVTASADLTRTDRDLVWVSAAHSSFTTAYYSTTTIAIGGDVRWLISGKDALIADLRYTAATVDQGNTKPYVPAVKAMATYQRDWTSNLSSTASLLYIGERYADLANAVALSGYIDMRLGAAYTLDSSLEITANAQNLLGSTIVLWDGYRERGIFISAGIIWKF